MHSWAIQWLRLCLSMQGVQFRYLVREPRSHMPCGQKTKNIKQKQYCNKFNKDFKNCPHQKSLKKNLKENWLDLLAVQGTLKSLLQHYSSKTSILWYTAFFMVQLSHLFMTTGKTIALSWSSWQSHGHPPCGGGRREVGAGEGAGREDRVWHTCTPGLRQRQLVSNCVS